MPIKDKLRELLDLRGMKPADLARESGVSESMLSYYLSGKREPMGKTCFKLASALNVSVDELLETPFANIEKKAAPEQPFSLDEYARASNMSDLEITIIKTYMDLPHHTRQAAIAILRKILCADILETEIKTEIEAEIEIEGELYKEELRAEKFSQNAEATQKKKDA